MTYTLQSTLRAITRSSTGWKPGENLSRLQIQSDQQEALHEGIRHREHKRGAEAKAWGASFFLSAARLFARTETGDFSYDRIARELKLGPHFALTNTEYNLIEQGCRHWWGISIQRSASGRRQFHAAMLQHSGGAFEMLCETVELATARMLEFRNEAQAEHWLEELGPGDLRKKQLNLLASSDARIAAAEGLVALGTLRNNAPTVGDEGVWEQLQPFAPSSHAAERLFEALMGRPFHGTDAAGPTFWRWTIDEHLSVILLLDRTISPDGVPPEVQKLVVALEGALEKLIYERQGSQFELSGEVEALRPSCDGSTGSLVMRYRAGADRITAPLGHVRHPASDEGYAIFDAQTGKPFESTAPKDGDLVVVVPEPGFELRMDRPFQRVRTSCGAVWRGTISSRPTPIYLGLPEDEWPTEPTDVLAAGKGRLRILYASRDRARIDGLILGHTRAFRNWPVLACAERAGYLRVHVTGPSMDQEFELRVSPILHDFLPSDPEPGKYIFSFSSGNRTKKFRFWILPKSCSLSCESTESILSCTVEGTENVSVLLRDETKRWVPQLTLDDPEHGKLSLHVRATFPTGQEETTGRWTVFHAIERAWLNDGSGHEVPPRTPLRENMTLYVTGKPGASVTVGLFGHDANLEFNAHGHARLRVAEYLGLGSWKKMDAVYIDVSWHGRTKRKLGPFYDQRELQPTLKIAVDGDRTYLTISGPTSSELGPVRLVSIQAWQPWMGVTEHDAWVERAEDDVTWYGSHFDPKGKPHIVGFITERGRRLTGMRLVNRLDDGYAKVATAPDDLTPLQRSLWNRPSEETTQLFRDFFASKGGAEHVASLCSVLRTFGTTWFLWSEHYLIAARYMRLAHQIRGEWEGKQQTALQMLYLNEHLDPCMCTYDDLRHALEQLSELSTRQKLEALGQLHVGLTVAVFLGARDELPNLVDLISLYWEVNDGLKPLGPHRDALIEAPDRLQQTNDSMRIRGLAEAQENLRPSDRAQIERLGDRYRTELAEIANDDSLRSCKKLPEQLRRFSLISCAVALALHRWRGQSPTQPASRLNKDVGYVRTQGTLLFDFWLNWWFKRDKKQVHE